MANRESPEQGSPGKIILERRKQRDADLSCAEIMRIVRQRAAKAARKSQAATVSSPDSILLERLLPK
jgi:hypothetical protein